MFEGVKNKTVLVTGTSGGIGASIARLFASYGAIVGLHYNHHKAQAYALREAITAQGGRAECFQGDFLDHAVCRALVRAFLSRFGKMDVLVNNAGAVFGARDFLRLDEAAWEQTFALNTKAPFFLTQQAFAQMKRQGGGKIINISSIAAKYGGSSSTIHYGAAKAALDALTMGLARVGAAHNILVNSIRAGFIETDFHRKIDRTAAHVKERIDLIPLKRAGQPLDVARVALFLASEAGDYITGEILTVSGGD